MKFRTLLTTASAVALSFGLAAGAQAADNEAYVDQIGDNNVIADNNNDEVESPDALNAGVQDGSNNYMDLYQEGDGNWIGRDSYGFGSLQQTGNSHVLDVSQVGNDNKVSKVNQRGGNNNEAYVDQDGERNKVRPLNQAGFRNFVDIDQKFGNDNTIDSGQVGDDNWAQLTQYGGGNSIELIQGAYDDPISDDINVGETTEESTNSLADILQDGYGNDATLAQFGANHDAYINQTETNNNAFVVQKGTGHYVDINQTGGSNVTKLRQEQ